MRENAPSEEAPYFLIPAGCGGSNHNSRIGVEPVKVVGPKRFGLMPNAGNTRSLEEFTRVTGEPNQARMAEIYASSRRWGEENRKLRESIARGETIVVHEQRELSLVIQR